MKHMSACSKCYIAGLKKWLHRLPPEQVDVEINLLQEVNGPDDDKYTDFYFCGRLLYQLAIELGADGEER